MKQSLQDLRGAFMGREPDIKVGNPYGGREKTGREERFVSVRSISFRFGRNRWQRWCRFNAFLPMAVGSGSHVEHFSKRLGENEFKYSTLAITGWILADIDGDQRRPFLGQPKGKGRQRRWGMVASQCVRT